MSESKKERIMNERMNYIRNTHRQKSSYSSKKTKSIPTQRHTNLLHFKVDVGQVEAMAVRAGHRHAAAKRREVVKGGLQDRR